MVSCNAVCVVQRQTALGRIDTAATVGSVVTGCSSFTFCRWRNSFWRSRPRTRLRPGGSVSAVGNRKHLSTSSSFSTSPSSFTPTLCRLNVVTTFLFRSEVLMKIGLGWKRNVKKIQFKFGQIELQYCNSLQRNRLNRSKIQQTPNRFQSWPGRISRGCDLPARRVGCGPSWWTCRRLCRSRSTSTSCPPSCPMSRTNPPLIAPSRHQVANHPIPEWKSKNQSD